MSTITITAGIWDANRRQTLALLEKVEQMDDTQEVLGWRPGPGRAHIAWQLMHIAATEELFATQRLTDQSPPHPELIERFGHGSVPDDDIPTPQTIREYLGATREHLKRTVGSFTDADLDWKPPALQKRGWSLGDVLNVMAYHEPHHQGQAHITLNLYKAAHQR